jgi:UDP-glucose 4-epimerase
MSTVAVTGASGFIGAALCQRLQQEGCRVRAVVRQRAEGPWDEATRVNLGYEPVPAGLLTGVDCVFHAAGKAHALADSARAEQAYRASNVQSTLDLLAEAGAQRVRAFVYFSSVKAMGEGCERAQDEESAPNPRTAYGRTKLAAERAVLKGGQVPHPVVLRPTLVYGPNPKGYLGLMVRTVSRGWFPPLPELGNGRSMIHRDDVVEAALLVAADRRAAGGTYVLADGHSYSSRDIYAAICAALGRPVPHWTLSPALLRMAARIGDGIGRLRGKRFLFDSEVLEKLAGSALYDGGRICRELGFRPTRNLMGSMPEIVAGMLER